MFTGSVSDMGVTIRLAPRLRNSRARRSPTSSATVSVAVATAMPTTSAAAVSTLRRGLRTNDSRTRRANILGVDRCGGASQRRKINDHLSPHDAGFHGDGIATAVVTDGRDVDGRAAIPADHVLSFLAVSRPAANLAGVERSRIVAVRFVDDEEVNHR